MTQPAPCADLLDDLPTQQARAAVTLGPNTLLVDLLDNFDAFAELEASVLTGSDSLPTIHSHVNRILDRVAMLEEVHANGSAQLTAHWIFNCGAWNMSTTNKGFNITAEDHKVAKILSGWDASEPVALTDLVLFDTQMSEEIAKAQKLLFTIYKLLKTTMYSVNQRVLDVLTANLILRYPLLKEANPAGPAIKRLEECVLEPGCSVADLLVWITHLASVQAASSRATYATEKQQPRNNPSNNQSDATEEKIIIHHQASVIDHFIRHVKRQDERLNKLEAKPDRTRQPPDTTCSNDTSQEVTQPNKRRKKTSVTYLKTTWFAWYTQEPRLWNFHSYKQKKSDAKHLVAFMNLFFDAEFSLDAQSPTYRDQMMALGAKAKSSVLEFLREREVALKGKNAMQKELRVLYCAGALNDRTQRYRSLPGSSTIVGPAPGFTQDI